MNPLQSQSQSGIEPPLWLHFVLQLALLILWVGLRRHGRLRAPTPVPAPPFGLGSLLSECFQDLSNSSWQTRPSTRLNWTTEERRQWEKSHRWWWRERNNLILLWARGSQSLRSVPASLETLDSRLLGPWLPSVRPLEVLQIKTKGSGALLSEQDWTRTWCFRSGWGYQGREAIYCAF